MRSIEFDEEQMADLDSVIRKMYVDEQDPRSSAYRRVLIRPEIPWRRIMLFLAATLIFSFVAIGILIMLHLPLIASAAILLLLTAGYLALFLKRAVIMCVKIYQHYAPDSVRKKCRFEPSCSEYMIRSIEKYGLLKGMNRGIGRLRRCNINNGGYDEP